MDARTSKLRAAARRVLRSIGVGGIATGADLLVLAVAVSGFGVGARIASIPALLVGIAVQFVGNKWFAFEDRSRAWVKQGALFLAVEAAGLIANAVVYDLLIQHSTIPYLLARLISTSLVYFGICLPLWSLIFRPRDASGRHPEEVQA